MSYKLDFFSFFFFCTCFQDAIAYLPLIMLISATVSSGISKKVVGIMGSKVSIDDHLSIIIKPTKLGITDY